MLRLDAMILMAQLGVRQLMEVTPPLTPQAYVRRQITVSSRIAGISSLGLAMLAVDVHQGVCFIVYMDL